MHCMKYILYYRSHVRCVFPAQKFRSFHSSNGYRQSYTRTPYTMARSAQLHDLPSDVLCATRCVWLFGVPYSCTVCILLYGEPYGRTCACVCACASYVKPSPNVTYGALAVHACT